MNKIINQRQDEGKKEVDTRSLKLWWNLLHNKCIVAFLIKKLKTAHGGSKVVPGLSLYIYELFVSMAVRQNCDSYRNYIYFFEKVEIF